MIEVMHDVAHKALALCIVGVVIIFCGCERTPAPPDIPMQEITGRGEGTHKRTFVYRIRPPLDWIRRDPLAEETLEDTMKALCEFFIIENAATIRIAIHNFPSEMIQASTRIPPAAQVERWKKQFSFLEEDSTIIPQAFSGYTGLLFTGKGLMQDKPMAIRAWALQLDAGHYRKLQHPSDEKEARTFKQMGADVTIKAIGPPELMEKHHKAIVAFARSFELIRDLP